MKISKPTVTVGRVRGRYVDLVLVSNTNPT